MIMLGLNSVLKEVDFITENNYDIVDRLDEVNELLETTYLTEEEYNKVVQHLKLEIMDIDKFIAVNDCQCISNPIFYVRNNIPSDDGLLSNTIFGITRDDRAGIFAYIKLNGWFLDPSCYKTWVSLDRHIKEVIHGMDTYIVNSKGEIVPDPSGKNGIVFLKENINKIKFRKTDDDPGSKRNVKIKYLEMNKNKMFINKYIVIPPFYRDTNTGNNGSVGVGGVNTLYRNLILAANGILTTQDYGFDQSSAMVARIQETLLQIYDWFAGNSNKAFNNVETGLGLSKKRGIIHSANMSKTTNYSSRTVIVSSELKAETVDDMMVKFDQTAIPLAVCMANYRPFMQFQVRRFFENQFMGKDLFQCMNKNGKIEFMQLKDPLIEFSDERIKREMDRFLHGYNNRLVPIELPVVDAKSPYYMQFVGRYTKESEVGENPEAIYNRRLTWCDIFYQCAVEVTRDKNLLITRYPMDSYFNQMTCKCVVSSTKETEPMYIGNTYYPYYPKIREEDIGSNTGNMFVDTTMLSNLYLAGLSGDYDGDTTTVKGPYTVEANQELEEFANSKANFIDLGGKNIRTESADVVHSMYSLTKTLTNGKKVTDPVFE